MLWVGDSFGVFEAVRGTDGGTGVEVVEFDCACP